MVAVIFGWIRIGSGYDYDKDIEIVEITTDDIISSAIKYVGQNFAENSLSFMSHTYDSFCHMSGNSNHLTAFQGVPDWLAYIGSKSENTTALIYIQDNDAGKRILGDFPDDFSGFRVLSLDAGRVSFDHDQNLFLSN